MFGLRKTMGQEDNVKKILLFGTADLSGKSIGGQLEKTRLLYEHLKREKCKIFFCNTYVCRCKLILLGQLIIQYMNNRYVIVITSHKGTAVISRILWLLKKIRRRKIIFIIVGNQEEFIIKTPRRYLNIVDKYYFEIDVMAERLEDFLEKKVGIIRNCKKIAEVKDHFKISSPLKICYYSQISYRKGFDILVEVLDKINKDRVIYMLDVYGFFDSEEDKMRQLIKNRPYIEFRGSVKREKSMEYLNSYLFMVFPSRHPLEGVPGAIVDAFEAGLPVICSDIGYLPYVVRDNVTGYIYHNIEELTNLMTDISENPQKALDLRSNCMQEAQKYDIDVAMDTLLADMRQG